MRVASLRIETERAPMSKVGRNVVTSDSYDCLDIKKRCAWITSNTGKYCAFNLSFSSFMFGLMRIWRGCDRKWVYSYDMFSFHFLNSTYFTLLYDLFVLYLFAF